MNQDDRALAIRGLSKSFEATRALQNVDLEVLPSQFVALLGRNGAGKSTLLQLLTGLFAPDAGTIQVCGWDVRTTPVPALAQLGVVFQQQTLDLELSVRANLQFFADLQGLPRQAAAEAIGTALERHGLGDLAGKAVRTLSGGNRRRVELARALLHAPKVLIMDEATVGLDPASRHALLTQVLDLCGTQNLAALWATHLVEEAATADRVVVLEQGHVIFNGAPADLAASHPSGDLGKAFLALSGSEASG